MIDKRYKEIMDIVKNSPYEKEMIESMLDMGENGRKLKLIGKNEDMKSQYKNELFNGIYEDENGIIMDVRIVERKPTADELVKMVEYWTELKETYNREVQPCFVMREK